MTTQRPLQHHCPDCGAPYLGCAETDWDGRCMQRTMRIEEGQIAYVREKGSWLVEHIPTGHRTDRYDSETSARNAVAAGRALMIVHGRRADRKAA